MVDTPRQWFPNCESLESFSATYASSSLSHLRTPVLSNDHIRVAGTWRGCRSRTTWPGVGCVKLNYHQRFRTACHRALADVRVRVQQHHRPVRIEAMDTYRSWRRKKNEDKKSYRHALSSPGWHLWNVLWWWLYFGSPRIEQIRSIWWLRVPTTFRLWVGTRQWKAD